jgi:hypothetical protein
LFHGFPYSLIVDFDPIWAYVCVTVNRLDTGTDNQRDQVMTTMKTTIEVPARGRKWTAGTIVRDGVNIYRVSPGRPRHYHEDCLAVQSVTAVRNVPAEWAAVTRLLAIMDAVKTSGSHTPSSRGASADKRVAECPAMTAPITAWEARQEERSYANYPKLAVSGDVLRVAVPVYDDTPVVVWLQDSALAAEAIALIASNPRLTMYPTARVRSA